MTFLLLSIAFSTSLLVVFKIFERFGINNVTGIVVNYVTAASTGFILGGMVPDVSAILSSEWSFFAFLIGTLFISLFFIVALSSQQNGIGITSVANKMSLVIPVIAAIFLYGEQPGSLAIVGIIIALAGVVLTSLKSDASGKISPKALLYPGIIFLGSGSCDALLKYVEVHFLSNVSAAYFSAVLFATAGIVGLCIFIFLQIRKPFSIRPKDIAGGILLGVPNYFSIHFLFLAFSHSPWPSSTLIPINNIGVVVASALTGYILFRERFSPINIIGIVLSIAAILMIAFGS